MDKQEKIKLIEKYYREGKIKRIGNSSFSVPSDFFILGITPRLVNLVLNFDINPKVKK